MDCGSQRGCVFSAARRLLPAFLFVLPVSSVAACGLSVIIEVEPGANTDGGVDVAPDGPGSSATIGPAGGRVELGAASITIPAGALSHPVAISLSIATSAPPSAFEPTSQLYLFEPTGLVFARPARVVLPSTSTGAGLAVYWSAAFGVGYDRLDTTFEGKSATASVSHFSTGFVGAGGSHEGGVPLDSSSDSPALDAPGDSPAFDAPGDGGIDGDASDGSTCAKSDGGLTTLVPVATAPFAIAVNATGVYWASAGDSVYETSLDGCTTITIATGQNVPTSVALDSTYVYWTNNASEGPGGSVVRAPQGGGTVTTLAPSLNGPNCITTDGTQLYWFNGKSTGYLVSMPVAGGAQTTLTTVGDALDLALSGSTLFWPDTLANTVQAISTSGGSPRLLSSAASSSEGVAADSTNVYFTTYVSPGGVYQVPQSADAATAPLALATGYNSPVPVATDGTNVYFAEYIPTSGRILKVPVGGGPVTTLATGQGGPMSIAVDSTSVYWVNYLSGQVMKFTPK